MDDYKHQILQALTTNDADKLTMLVPSIEIDEAEDYITEYSMNQREIMEAVKSGIDCSAAESRQLSIIDELANKSHISGLNKF